VIKQQIDAILEKPKQTFALIIHQRQFRYSSANLSQQKSCGCQIS
jgi:hypothetical protein